MDWDTFKAGLASEASRGVKMPDILTTMGEFILALQCHKDKAAAHAAIYLLVKAWDYGYQYGYKEGEQDARDRD